MTKQKFTIPVKFEMWGNVEVEAETLDEAIEKAIDSNLPKEKHYLEQSTEYFPD